MSDRRPDPDALLAHITAEETRQKRGQLKIFFGAAPGVGKTYSMLEAGKKAAADKVDVVAGYIEPHNRPETQALLAGLEILPTCEAEYRGLVLAEFDLQRALERRPQLILLDEAAHTNAPGMIHTKRWLDIQQLLGAGINVYTTLNVQHLESLNDVIAGITGVSVRETVPDSLFDQADEIELVDLPPDDLLQRLAEGKVYLPQQAQRAVENFFSKGNLIALREIALRKVAERVEAQAADYRAANLVQRTWPTRERLLVCVGPSPFAARLIRATRRMASSLHCSWAAVYVESQQRPRLEGPEKERLTANLQLAQQLGGEVVTLSGYDAADEIVHYARTINATKIVVGKPLQPRWKEWIKGSLVYDLARKCGEIDVYVISGDPAPDHPSRMLSFSPPRPSSGYLWGVLTVALCTGIGWLMSQYLAITNLVMIYLLGVLGMSLRYGRGPSTLTSVLGVLAFDFCFVPPRLTFVVVDTQYVFTLAVMLITGITISTLTSRVKFQAESARERERRTASLYALSRELSAIQTREEIVRTATRLISQATKWEPLFFLPDASGRPVPAADHAVTSPHEESIMIWVYEHAQPAGRGTMTLPTAARLYLPLQAARGIVGVLSVQAKDSDAATLPEQLQLLEALTSLVALALERVSLAEEAQQSHIQMEAERLRSSLLSAVSHDLRTPLSVITGAASTLLNVKDGLSAAAAAELLQSVLAEAERLNRLVGNLLDMTRLEGRAITLNKEWQPMEEIVGVVLSRLARVLKGHKVITALPADLPWAPMDEMLMQQVVVNLLENASKYAPSGSEIVIRASVDEEGLHVEVADQGPGVPEDELERIFERFCRGKAFQSRQGSGLGLAICRGIIELHGGRIWAQNRAEGGAAFHFALPIPSDALAIPQADLLEEAG